MAAAISLFLLTTLQLAPPGGTTGERAPSSRPGGVISTHNATSHSTTQPDDPLIASLIADLGSTDFRKRTEAQQRLTKLGVAALPTLIRHINNPSPEIAERVQAIVQAPADVETRVDMAVAMLATRRPEMMERAVYMMFDMPEPCCDLFLARVPAMRGRDRLVGEAIAEQFRAWRGGYEAFKRGYERARKRDADAAARLQKSQLETDAVNAEAAFQLALEALEESTVANDGGAEVSTTRPSADSRQVPTSQRS